jgi:moderate conductance mechanosensitive channel
MDLHAAAPGLLAQLPQVTDDQLAQACAGEYTGSTAICELVFRTTGSRIAGTFAGSAVPGLLRIAIIILVAWFVNRLLKRSIKRFVRTMNERGMERLSELARKGPLTATTPMNLQRATMRTETIGGVLNSVTTIVVWGIAALMILGIIGVNLGPLIAGAGIAGVALGFGAQSLVKDFLTGIFMILEDQFGVGDIVDVGEARGTVEAVTLRTTKIRDISGTLWHVPNGEIARVGNMSQLWSRALLDIGVAYDTDIARASDVLQRVADGMAAEPEWGEFFFEPADIWGVQELADNQITIRMVVKVTPAKQWAIERELRARIKLAFDREGIEIPFPQRTIWVRDDRLLGDGPRGRRDDGTPRDPQPAGSA